MTKKSSIRKIQTGEIVSIAVTDPFSEIAKPAAPTTKKSSKLTAKVNDTIKSAVDKLVSTKATLTSLEAEKADLEEKIINHVRPQQDDNARKGDFSKSYLVEGNSSNVTYVTSDRFSVPKTEEELDALKRLLGQDRFNAWFEKKRTIKLKESASTNQTFITALRSALDTAGLSFADSFEVTDITVAKSDLDMKQYELGENVLEQFRTLCRQNKPALK